MREGEERLRREGSLEKGEWRKREDGEIKDRWERGKTEMGRKRNG